MYVADVVQSFSIVSLGLTELFRGGIVSDGVRQGHVAVLTSWMRDERHTSTRIIIDVVRLVEKAEIGYFE